MELASHVPLVSVALGGLAGAWCASAYPLGLSVLVGVLVALAAAVVAAALRVS